jgi:Arc/MetJ family transcription regulator
VSVSGAGHTLGVVSVRRADIHRMASTSALPTIVVCVSPASAALTRTSQRAQTVNLRGEGAFIRAIRPSALEKIRARVARRKAMSVGGCEGLRSASKACRLICMRTTLDLDETLVKQALEETGAKSKTEVIEMGLRALLEREARRQLKLLRGRLPRLKAVPRRRA